MTREEELLKHLPEQHQRNQEIDKATQNMSIQERAGFVVGVEWADQHPRKGLWDSKKICQIIHEVINSDTIGQYLIFDDENIDFDSELFFEDLQEAMED